MPVFLSVASKGNGSLVLSLLKRIQGENVHGREGLGRVGKWALWTLVGEKS